MTATTAPAPTAAGATLPAEEVAGLRKLLEAWVKAQDVLVAVAERDPAWLTRIANAAAGQPTFPVAQVASEFATADAERARLQKEREAIQAFLDDTKRHFVHKGTAAPGSVIPLVASAVADADKRIVHMGTIKTQLEALRTEIESAAGGGTAAP